jgi:hypothetical protein
MKHFITLLSLLTILSLSLVSCSDIEKLINDEDDPNTIGGSTEISLNTIGNEFTMSDVRIDGQSVELHDKIIITKNENGILTIKVDVDLSDSPELAGLMKQIPKELIGDNNKISTEIKFKSTSEGMQDNFNADEKFFTIAKYNCKVGDTYTYTNSNGKKLVRTVTKKSTTDDFEYGWYYIKVIQVEQEIGTSGIDKFIYHLNHKFGLVHFEAKLEDGSSIKSFVLPTYSN